MDKWMKRLMLSAAVIGLFFAASVQTFAAAYLNYGTSTYVRNTDDAVYDFVLGKFAAAMTEAEAEDDLDLRYVRYAKAEAELLNSGAVLPRTTPGGNFAITRVAPHTTPEVGWGQDSDRKGEMVISEDLLTSKEVEDLRNLWKNAQSAGTTYDPASYLKSKGHKLLTTYCEYFSTAPKTLDWHRTYQASDLDILVNTMDSLARYDNMGNLQPALATGWTVSSDGLTYTFTIRQGVNWYTSSGTKYATLKASDFVAAFRYQLDHPGDGMIASVSDYIAGANAYMNDSGSWSNVGFKATGDYKLVITLSKKAPFFKTLLSTPVFWPMCESFYNNNKSTYGSNGVTSQVYLGPFLFKELDDDNKIILAKNTNYYDAANIRLEKLEYLYDTREEALGVYNKTIDGTYTSCGLGTAEIEQAKLDGILDTYGYTTETNSGTTYFGLLNLNRGTFYQNISGEVASPKNSNEKAKISAAVALSNQKFRQALLYAIDKASCNAPSQGEALKNSNLRNMICNPNFVHLSKAVKDDSGHTFSKNTQYGDIVQYYLNQLGSKVNVYDGVDGWHHADTALTLMKTAATELGNAVTFPVQIDYVYNSYYVYYTQQAENLKASVEDVLGNYVTINLVPAENSTAWYYSSYYVDGADINTDYSDISGWGADYGDPSTMLDIFLKKGYMIGRMGLSDFTSGPSIISQPQNVTAATGNTAKFTVKASGDSLSYQWYYRNSASDSWKTCTSSSGKTDTYSFTTKEASTGHQYRCKVTDSSGQYVYTNVVTLKVTPKITTQPKSITEDSGKTVTFTVAAEGTSLKYQWYYRNNANDTWKASTSDSGKTASYSFTAKETSSGHQYRCKVTNSYGTYIYSNAATLTVTSSAPKITTQPKNVKVAIGDTAKFTVAASGTNLTYQWYYRNDANDTWKASSNESGKTAAYSFTAKENASGHQYRCKVSGNGAYVYTNAVTLTVTPKITKQPASVTVANGDTVAFKVTANGTNLKYQWYYRNDANDTWKASSNESGKTATYTFPAKDTASGHQYRCKVSNDYSYVYTNAVTLKVTAKITKQPKSVSVSIGDTASFTVTATGTNLTYQWYYRNDANDTWKASSNESGKTATYSFPAKEASSGHQYRCRVSNGNGYVYTNAVTLTVNPKITTQPKSVTVKAGDTISLKVAATGTNLKYQWYYRNDASDTWKASKNETGKTAVYTFPAKEETNGHQYRCKVTSSYGYVYSSIVTVTVK